MEREHAALAAALVEDFSPDELDALAHSLDRVASRLAALIAEHTEGSRP